MTEAERRALSSIVRAVGDLVGACDAATWSHMRQPQALYDPQRLTH